MSDGALVWVTGLPRSGKSTFGRRVVDALRGAGRAALLLDGDAVRKEIFPELGYDAAARDHFYDKLARLAALLANEGMLVVVAATAHRARYRAAARALAPAFVEVQVTTPPSECAAREGGGLLYGGDSAAALPGAGVVYELPTAPDVVATGGLDDAAVGRVLAIFT